MQICNWSSSRGQYLGTVCRNKHLHAIALWKLAIEKFRMSLLLGQAIRRISFHEKLYLWYSDFSILCHAQWYEQTFRSHCELELYLCRKMRVLYVIRWSRRHCNVHYELWHALSRRVNLVYVYSASHSRLLTKVYLTLSEIKTLDSQRTLITLSAHLRVRKISRNQMRALLPTRVQMEKICTLQWYDDSSSRAETWCVFIGVLSIRTFVMFSCKLCICPLNCSWLVITIVIDFSFFSKWAMQPTGVANRPASRRVQVRNQQWPFIMAEMTRLLLFELWNLCLIISIH